MFVAAVKVAKDFSRGLFEKISRMPVGKKEIVLLTKGKGTGM